MSDDAKTLMYWVNGWRETAVADYGNECEFWFARRWAAYIIAGACSR